MQIEVKNAYASDAVTQQVLDFDVVDRPRTSAICEIGEDRGGLPRAQGHSDLGSRGDQRNRLCGRPQARTIALLVRSGHCP